MAERKPGQFIQPLTKLSLETVADSVFWLRSDGRIIYVNRAACESLGYSRKKLLSFTISDIDPNYPAENWESFSRRARMRWLTLAT